MSTHPGTLLARIIVATLIAAPAFAQTDGSQYSAIDVGPWSTSRFFGRAVINEAGQVAATAGTAYLWTNGNLQHLPVILPDGTTSEARAINDRGQVAGLASLDSNPFNYHGAVWTNGVIEEIGAPLSSGGGLTDVQGIDERGQISGSTSVELPTGGVPTHPFARGTGAMFDLGTLPIGNDPGTLNNTSAFAWNMNEIAGIVGESPTAPPVSPGPVGPTHAFLWQPSVFTDLGTLPGGTTSSARDANNLGQVVGTANDASGNLRAFLWQDDGQGMQDLGSLGGSETVAEAINDRGQIVGYSQTATGRFHAFLYENGVMKDLNNLFDNTPFPGWGELTRATDINNQGDIVGVGDHGSRRTFLLRKLCRDTDGNGNADNDGDGLCDNWETDGIDVDGDGLVDLRLYDMNGNGVIDAGEQANLNRKDLYVEVDWMQGHKPFAEALKAVVDRFNTAPVDVGTGHQGIALHLLVDEEAVGHADQLAFADDDPSGTLPHFDEVKDQRFGTALERASTNAARRLEAKKLAFRYALFIHNRPGTTSSGRAELPGNDFTISLGSFAIVLGHNVGNLDQQAATFMHEFGHTLDLHHGGDDDFNCKPNFLSIMSYSRQFPGAIADRLLDYSDTKLATLDEASLDEAAGVGGPPGSRTAVGPDPYDVVPADGPIDWNRINGSSEIGIHADANRLTPESCDGEGTVLEGHDDWSDLVYNFRTSPDFADGVHETVVGQPEEITLEQALGLSSDTDGDGVTNLLDNCLAASNPGQADTDGDGIGSACDNCSAVVNLDQRDTDGDGYGNMCDADLNNSGGAVNFTDLALFRSVFGTPNANADFDGSGGAVNFTDLATFRRLFGSPPGPSGLHP